MFQTTIAFGKLMKIVLERNDNSFCQWQRHVKLLGWTSIENPRIALGQVELLQMRETPQPPLPACQTDEIVTNTSNWIWFKNGTRTPPVVVDFYLPQVKIPNAANGATVLPIWSELLPAGQATCGNCNFDFWNDYTLPAGYTVQSASIDIQADDQADIFLNFQGVGSATWSETFGSGTYKRYLSPHESLWYGREYHWDHIKR